MVGYLYVDVKYIILKSNIVDILYINFVIT